MENNGYKKYKTLPCPEHDMQVWYRIVCGFGYDELHDDYKVVVGFYEDDYDPYGEVKIYSLKSDSWTNVDYGGVLVNGPAMFVNGKLHWATCDPDLIGRKNMNIISFDLADEKWEKMEHPCYGEEGFLLKVGVLRSDLFVFSEYESTHIDVWVMKEYGKEQYCQATVLEEQLNPILIGVVFSLRGRRKGKLIARSQIP
ncbi:hypothetical protein RND71_040060 [Anisodus tanguticus]|uniref:F-box associated beta-propeller type 1 domain-containing protein n=1 Tax=Anisodus tanguticus TaxID=243964 RepID=A0AAE1UY53_9SOLA|nr:hypothetical protein RND71_040060 [Anisodus tanguticus]